MKIRDIRNLRGAIAIATSLTISASAVAEPQSVVQWLMNEPVSMWDFGLSELGDFLERAWDENHVLGRSMRGASYDPDRNRLVLEFYEFKVFDKEHCRIMIEQARREGHIRADGTPYPSNRNGFSVYASFFSKAAVKGNEPDNYLSQIDKIIEVKVTMDGGSCTGPLISSEILYGK